jgi:rubredoxin-NAD+ reductase
VLLLGAGLIGCEFANDLILGGYEIDLVAPCEQVMPPR